MKKRNKSKWSKVRKTTQVLAAALAVTPMTATPLLAASAFTNVTFEGNGKPVELLADKGNPLQLNISLDKYFHIGCSSLSYLMVSTVTGTTYSLGGSILALDGPANLLTDTAPDTFTIRATNINNPNDYIEGSFNIRGVTPPAPKLQEIRYAHYRPNSAYNNIPLYDLFTGPDDNLTISGATVAFGGTTFSSDNAYFNGSGTNLSLMLKLGSSLGTRTVTISVYDNDYADLYGNILPTHKATKTFYVDVTNHSPVVNPSFGSTINLAEGHQRRIKAKALFTDPDGDSLRYTFESGTGTGGFTCVYYDGCSDSFVINSSTLGSMPVTITASDAFGGKEVVTLSVNTEKVVRFGHYDDYYDYHAPSFFDSSTIKTMFDTIIPVAATRNGTFYLTPTELSIHSLADIESNQLTPHPAEGDGGYQYFTNFFAEKLTPGKYRAYLVYDSDNKILTSSDTIIVLDSGKMSTNLKAGGAYIDISKIVSYSNKSGETDSTLRQDRDYVQALLEFIPPKFVTPIKLK